MSTKITYSDPFYNISHNQILSQKSQHPYAGPVRIEKTYFQVKRNKPLNFVNRKDKKGIYTVRCNSANSTGSQAPPPGKSPFFGWKWLLGFLLPILLPSFRNKVSPLQLLINNVNKAVETVETMTEIVEEVAEEVEKLTEEVQKKLPGDSKLKESLHSIEILAEEAVKYANQAQDIIHKVEDIENEMEDTLMHPSNTPQAERVGRDLSAKKD